MITTTMLFVVLLMVAQFIFLQNYINRILNQQTEKVELLLKSASTMERKIDEIKEDINEK